MRFFRRIICMMILSAFLLGAVCQAGAESVYYGIGFVNTDGLNLRSGPGTDTAVLAIARRDECVVIVEELGEWLHVIYNLTEGYMSATFVSISKAENAELGYGMVVGDGVNLRSGPGTNYAVTGSVSSGQKLYIIGMNNGWYKVRSSSSDSYIRSDFLKLTEIPYENNGSVNQPKYFRHGRAIEGSAVNSSQSISTAAISGQGIVNKAAELLGKPYVNGGAGPDGFDCSGLVYYVLRNFGLSPSRTPTAQFEMGTPVEKSDLRPGDIVFFSGNGSYATHCGIYAGNGQFIHAPNSRSVVSYSDITSGYWAEHYFGARRVV